MSTDDNPHIKMFVASTLLEGWEDIVNIMGYLNYRGFLPWRNAVLRDFTLDDVLPALEALVRSGHVDLWLDWGNTPGTEADISALATPAGATDESMLFRLTIEGRKVVEAWEGPELLDMLLLKHVQASSNASASLYSAYQSLWQHTKQQLPLTEFAELLNFMLESDELRLWKSDNSTQNGDVIQIPVFSPDSHDSSKLPASLELFAPSEDQVELASYFLTLEDRGIQILNPPQKQEQERLIDIADPAVLLKKIIERDPSGKEWFVARKAVRHVVVDENGGLTIGVGSVAEFVAKVRWGKGLPEDDARLVRHIVIDENDNVIGHYYGPASSDSLDAE